MRIIRLERTRLESDARETLGLHRDHVGVILTSPRLLPSEKLVIKDLHLVRLELARIMLVSPRRTRTLTPSLERWVEGWQPRDQIFVQFETVCGVSDRAGLIRVVDSS